MKILRVLAIAVDSTSVTCHIIVNYYQCDSKSSYRSGINRVRELGNRFGFCGGGWIEPAAGASTSGAPSRLVPVIVPIAMRGAEWSSMVSAKVRGQKAHVKPGIGVDFLHTETTRMLKRILVKAAVRVL